MTNPSLDPQQDGSIETSLPDTAAIREQRDRILASASFQKSERLKHFLHFVVEYSLEGRAHELKEYLIGTEVFARKDTFDPALHSIVRVEARKLRSKLEEYYGSDGAGDTLRIELPRGGYAPVFRAREPVGARRPVPRTVSHRSMAAALEVATVAVAFAAWSLWPAARPGAVTRMVITPASGDQVAYDFQPAVALSPDGTRLVFAARHDGQTRLFLRTMDQFDSVAIAGTEGAAGPFFSPDGRWVGFFADNKLKKVSLDGGVPVSLCDAPNGRGGNWASDDTIVFTPASSPGLGLSRIPASGGVPRVVTTPDHQRGEIAHRWPEVLPGGGVLFTIWTGPGSDDWSIGVLPPKAETHRVLVESGSNAHYAAGFLVFQRGGGLMAAPLDLSRLELTAPPVQVIKQVMADARSGVAQFAVAGAGALAYVPGDVEGAESTLALVTRNGQATPVTEKGDFYFPSLSPDGGRIATRTGKAIWVHDIKRRTSVRLTFDESLNSSPIWASDGTRVIYNSNRSGAFNLFWKLADGSGREERLSWAADTQTPDSWSADGKWLIYDVSHAGTGMDIWLLTMEGNRSARPYLQTPHDECCARLSPDGRWIAYTSNESGRYEVYVQAFGNEPSQDGKWQVSTEGGAEPLWAPDQRELFYRSGDRMMAVPLKIRRTFTAARPQLLFEAHYEAYPLTTSYDVTPDRQRFLMVKSSSPSGDSNRIHVVLNWLDELKAQRRAHGKYP